MTPKLQAKTIRLKPRKKRSLYLGAIFNLAVSIIAFKLLYITSFGFGKFILFLLGAAGALIAIFNVFGLIRLYKEGFVGLFISGEGLNDISTGNTYGMVQWKDVYKIKVIDDIEHPKYKYIILKVQNPQDYIDREYIGYKKRSLVLKFHYYGSPVCFSNRALDCSFDELYQTITTYYENYQTRKVEREAEEVY